MKIFKNRWKLGFFVMCRTLVFMFAANILVTLSVLPVHAIRLLPQSAPPTAKTAVWIAAIVYLCIMIPLAFYWAAEGTGFMQGSDKEKFKKDET